MSLQSLKARFVGSYLILVVLFVIQIPILYVILSGMGDKYVQEDVAGSLRKRAVSVVEVLNRHIVTGEAVLAEQFNQQKIDYNAVITILRTGSEKVPAITDPELLVKLTAVEARWELMRSVLDDGMTDGVRLVNLRKNVEDSTFPMVAKFNTMIAGMQATGSDKVMQSINAAGLQRMRTVKLSYLFSRAFLTYGDKSAIEADIDKTVKGFEGTLGDLKVLALGVGGKGQAFRKAVEQVESYWKTRKAYIYEGTAAARAYHGIVKDLGSNHTPAVVKIADELTKMFIHKAQVSAMNGMKIVGASVVVSALVAAFFMWSSVAMILRPMILLQELMLRWPSLVGRSTMRSLSLAEV